MIDVSCGYTGGKRADPTYHSMKDHTEAVRIVFDPSKISLEKLVDMFWEEHSPFSGRSSCQYRSCIWYLNEKQLKTIEKSRDALLKTNKKELTTGIEPAAEFYRAEEYHQKYYRKNRY